MKIGYLDIDARTPAEAIAGAKRARDQRFDSYWLPGGWRDPLTMLAVAGQHADSVRLGSMIVSLYASHPTALAEQALTVNAAVGDRLVLGVGVSHKQMVESRFGLSFDKPIRHLRESLTILDSLFDKGAVDFEGEVFSAHTELRLVGIARPVLLVAALSDQSLRVTGRLADGTVATFLRPERLAEHTVPTIRSAAAEAGRPEPMIVATMPTCVTIDEADARRRAAEHFAAYTTRYTAYRATFERQGVTGPGELAVMGDEEAVAAELARYADAGVTEFCAQLFGTPEERSGTADLIADLVRQARPIGPP